VHAPPDGAHEYDFGEARHSPKATLVYVFVLDTTRCTHAATLAPILEQAPAQTVAVGWLALRLATARLVLPPATVLALACAKVLAFDTEDAGTVGSVLQIGYVLADGSGGELLSHSALLNLPEGVAISPQSARKHHIDAEALRLHGADPIDELVKFKTLIDAARVAGVTMVAHGADGHVRQLNDTPLRHWSGATAPPIIMDEPAQRAVLCTMVMSVEHCGLHDRLNRPKQPSRAELFMKLLPDVEVPDDLNDALTDARMTMRSYLAGAAAGVWP
jgi:hypothetical protein